MTDEAPPPAAPAEPGKIITLLYLGIRVGHEDARSHAWANITEIPNDGRALDESSCKIHQYSKDKGAKKKKGQRNVENIVDHVSPGMIYTIEERGTSVMLATAKYIERWENQDDVARWQALSRANNTTIELKATANREAKQQRLHLERLEPIRDAYHQAPSFQRALILAEVVSYITGYCPAKQD